MRKKTPAAMFLVGEDGPAEKAPKKKGGWQWPPGAMGRGGELGCSVGKECGF